MIRNVCIIFKLNRRLDSSGIYWYSRNVKRLKLYANKSKTSVSFSCGSNYGRNQHCVYYIKSNVGYVNLSISKLMYTGDDWMEELSGIPDCHQGGVAFNTKLSHGNTISLCNNYTSNFTKINEMNVNKLAFDLVSDSEKSLILVVYSYKHYSQISLEATVSSTSCKGVFISHDPITGPMKDTMKHYSFFCVGSVRMYLFNSLKLYICGTCFKVFSDLK